MEVQSLLKEFFLHGFYEVGDIVVSRLLCRVEFFAYHLVCIVLEIFQREVLKFAFEFVESELVGERGV